MWTDGSETAFILAAYVLMSAVALGLYFLDKQRAGRGEWRISEETLHWTELLGGWPGAFLAQRVFRHKRRQARYMAVFWTIVGAHAFAWAWWLGLFG